MRKVIQIAASESTDDVTHLALCDDGTVWNYVWPKAIFKEIPATPDRNYTSHEKVGMTVATWELIPNVPQEIVYE